MSRTLQREGIWNTAISYAGILIGYVNTILLFPNFLDEAEVGLTRLLLSISVMYAQFSALGFVNMSVRYFPYFRDKEKQHNGFLFLLLSVPLLGFVLSTVLYLLFKPVIVDYYIENSPLIIDYYYYLIPLALFTLLFNMFTAYLRSLYKTIVSSFVQDFLLRLLTTLLISVYALGEMDFQTFVLLYVAVNCVGALVLVVYVIWLKQLFVRPSVTVFSIIPLKEVFYYGLFTFFGNISTTIITTVDQVMISSYSLAANGIYTTAFFMTSAILVPGKSILKIAHPQVAEFWKENNLTGMKKLYQDVTMINLIVGILLFIGIWANIDNLYEFMPESYRSGKYVVLFLAIARLVDLATSLNGAILATSEKYRWDLSFNLVLAALTIWTNWYFIPRYGIEGAALASMISLVSMNLLRLFFVQIIYKIQPFTWRALAITVIGVVSLGVSYLVPYLGNVFLDILVRSLLLISVYAALALNLNIYPEMNAWLRKVIYGLTGWKL
ncbi:O-antigen/teichoic acid export membrane protein [Pontibacter ummariensis]|uniref:Membrane protein involved in the export of O-antigen and teichoic acid n=1 Tax=Pontibacter ummariensis TaxID=1610492 RepID=A0A239DH15_9BACT|nr:polysaccharide biosynthesis C-terminal domain-containing protein [Pontibacter ummariensis]PRY14425.1 O-antigen/teichoic acid export membrane protein [Pontibacter ummariensis]SNS31700.1 Membrane protein involved in the export of O-antigen and teichoic acid [Pontibacter ummariensis]